jgi:hypothetical protein
MPAIESGDPAAHLLLGNDTIHPAGDRVRYADEGIRGGKRVPLSTDFDAQIPS